MISLIYHPGHKPCVFCGKNHKLFIQETLTPEPDPAISLGIYVKCDICGSQGPPGESKEHAWILWDRREIGA